MQLQHANLPETAQQIADVIGVEKTLELVRAKRESKCRSLYVPKPSHMRASHWLIQTIGEDAARELAAEYAGEPLTIPKCSGLIKQERNRQIVQMRRQGMKYKGIAEALGMNTVAVKVAFHRWMKANN